MQVNLDESAPAFGDAIERFATDCTSLWKGTVFVVGKTALHQSFAAEVAKMVDMVRSPSAGQNSIFLVGFFDHQRWLHKIFFDLLFFCRFFSLLDASFLVCSTIGMKFCRMHDFEQWQVSWQDWWRKMAKMRDFKWWRKRLQECMILSCGAELVMKDCKNA